MDAPNHWWEALAWLAGGIGLFLYGITLMSDGLRQVAGNRFRGLMATATRNPLAGFAIGTLITVLFQSSSASSVMVVGFIDAGLLTLRQSAGILLGSGLGSSLTAQLIAFRFVDAIALPAVAVGLVLYLFFPGRTTRHTGQCILGFGLLFFGFLLMKYAVEPWQNTTIRAWFAALGQPSFANRFLGLLVATLATAIVQSSAATVGIVMALAQQGTIPTLDAAIPLAIGCNIGTTATALIASIGSGGTARRSAVFFLVYRILAGILVLLAQPWFTRWIPLTADSPAHQIANFHTIENALMGLLFLPVARPLMWLVSRMVPTRETFTPALLHIDFGRAVLPAEACEQARKETIRVLKLAREMISDALKGSMEQRDSLLESVLKRETVVDSLHSSISEFLITTSRRTPPGTRPSPMDLLQVLHHAERIGDHAENLVELSRYLTDREFVLPPAMADDIRDSGKQIDALAGLVEDTLNTGNRAALDRSETLAHRFKIEGLARIQRCHVDVEEDRCTPAAAVLYEDIIANLMSAASHLRKAARAFFGFLPQADGTDSSAA